MVCKCSTAADVWASGCVLAELLEKKVLFRGRSPHHQLGLIFELLGLPNGEELREMGAAKTVIAYLKSRYPSNTGVSWPHHYPQASAGALDLLMKLLVSHPGKRITAAEAVRHNYFTVWDKPDHEFLFPTAVYCADEGDEDLVHAKRR